MAATKFVAYNFKAGELTNAVVEVDLADADEVKKLKELHKMNSALVVPLTLFSDEDGNESFTINEAGVEALLKPARRTAANWTDEMVVTAHELYVNEEKDPHRIMLELFVKHDGVEVTEDSIKRTLRQEINTGAPVDEDLRKAAGAKMPAKGVKGARRKYDDETKAKVVAFMEAMDVPNGKAAEREFGIDNGMCNKWYREANGYRRVVTSG